MRIVYLCFIVFLGSGCVTTYKKNMGHGGYSDLKLGNDMYQVAFQGNRYTSYQKVEKYFLKRCAELTKNQGYDHFQLFNEETDKTQKNMGSYNNGNFSKNYTGFNYTGTSKNVTAISYSKKGVIKVYKEGRQPANAFSAHEILKALEEDCKSDVKNNSTC